MLHLHSVSPNIIIWHYLVFCYPSVNAILRLCEDLEIFGQDLGLYWRLVQYVSTIFCLVDIFGPEKKYLAPPSPIPNSPQTPQPLPSWRTPPPCWDFQWKTHPPPPPGASDSPLPPPRAKKNKKYPKRPPRFEFLEIWTFFQCKSWIPSKSLRSWTVSTISIPSMHSPEDLGQFIGHHPFSRACSKMREQEQRLDGHIPKKPTTITNRNR